MMKHWIVFLFIFLGFSLLKVYANNNCCPSASAQLRKPQTLVSLIDLALTCNPSTRVAWSQVKAAAAAVGIANSAYYPYITGQLNASEGNEGNRGGFNNTFLSANSSSFSPTSSSVSPSSGTGSPFGMGANQFTYGGFVTLNYLIWDFGNRANTVKAARFTWLASRFNRDEVIQQTVLQVEQAYYQTLSMHALVQANQKDVFEARMSLKASQLLRQQGMATIGDVYQSESALAQAVLNLQQAQGSYDISRGQLNVAVGIPVNTCLRLRELPRHVPTKLTMRCINKLLQIAERRRPDLLAAKAQVCVNQAQWLAVRAQYWPVVQLTANAGRNYPKNSFGGGGFNDVTLNISIPIFTGYAQTYAIKQAKANLDQSKAQEEVVANQVALQVWQAYYNLQTATKMLKSSEAFLTSSEFAAKQGYGQYRAGVGSILTLLTTQATEANARGQYIQAQMNWYTALAQLYQALGTLCVTV
jgi:outer membrane protein